MTPQEIEARVQAIKRLALDAKPDALVCIVRQCIDLQLKLLSEHRKTAARPQEGDGATFVKGEPLYLAPPPLTGGDDRRHVICLCPDCVAPPAASLREQERTEVYAEGRSDQYADDGAVVRLLLENCDDADKESDGRMNTTRIRELLTHFDDAQRLGRGKDGAA
jgi:hypothetical protein